ncbi:MAG: DUF5050 domain-containing protein [Ekhidna sp.]
MKTTSKILFLVLLISIGDRVYSQTTDIVWMDNDTRSINIFDINRLTNIQLLQGSISNPRHIEVDKKNQKVYWADPSLKKISRSNLDGSVLEDVITFSGNTQFEGLAIDTLNNKIYWRTFNNGIERADLDGLNQEPVIGIVGNGDIAIDPVNNSVFWTSQIELKKADLDGANETLLATLENDFRSDLEIDITNQDLYFGDNNGNAIFRINTDGTGLETVFSQQGFIPKGIALDVPNNVLYSFNNLTNSILRINFDGSNATVVSNELSEVSLIDSDVEFYNDLLYTSRPTQLLSVDPATTNEVVLISSEIGAPREVAMNLNQILITDFDGGSILSHDLSSGETSTLIPTLNTPINIVTTEDHIYWTGSGGTAPGIIFQSAIDGTNQVQIFSDGNNQRFNDIDVDETNGYIYFSVGNWIANIGQIRRVPIEGGADELVVNSSAADQIAINHVTQEIFWNENSQLFKAGLDGSNVQEIIVPDFFPNDIKIDQDSQRLYWSDGFFRRVNVDGSNPEVVGSSSGDIQAFVLYDSIQTAYILQPTLEADSLALVDFYNATDGPTWASDTDWLQEGRNVTRWQGVSVENGRIVSLNFQSISNLIRGEIPPSIGDLTELTTLNLSGHRLSGTIPAEIVNLTKLRNLNLNVNFELIGAFPSLNGLDSLITLDISACSFEDLPDLSGLASLAEVYAASNLLEFDDIEPNISIPIFDYQQQRTFSSDTVIYDLSLPYNITPSTPGTSNIYQWFLNGDTIPGQTTNVLTVNPGENGDYKLLIENTLVPNLTLNSGAHRFTDTPPFIVNSDVEIFTHQIKTGVDQSLKNTVEVIDANGDGIIDLAIGLSQTMNYYNGGNRISSIPTVTYQITDPLRITNIASGQFTEDSFHDVAISVHDPNDYDGANSIVLMEGGSSLSESTVQYQEISLSGLGADFNLGSFTGPINIASLGDINNDGFEDLGLSTAGNASAIQIYFGGQSVFGNLTDKVEISAASFAHRLFKLEDINNDGIDDFGVSNPNSSEYFIYFGGNGKTDYVDPDLTISLSGSAFENNQQFFGWTTTISDVNNNSQPDILIRPVFARDPVISSIGTNSVFVLYGGSELDNIIDDAIRLPSSSSDPTFVSSNGLHDFQNLGDYDEDGVDDILVSQYGESFDAYIFPAQNISEASIPASTLKAPVQDFLGSRNNFLNYQASNAVGDFNDNGLLEVVLGQSTEDGYNLYFFENFEPPGDRYYDSLALVNLYQTTNGEIWSSSENWLETDMDTWEGVSLNSGRVIEINLPNRNLTGTIPDQIGNLLFLENIDMSGNQLEGALTETLVNLTSLEGLDLSNNEFSEVPDLNLLSSNPITSLDLSANRLDFEDLEPVFSLGFLNYADQKNISLYQPDTVLVPVTKDTTISVAIEGSSLSYQWKYDGGNLAGATDSTYSINSIDRLNMGSYSVEVESGLITDLTLTSDPIDVLATAIVSVNVTDFDSEMIDENVSGAIMETIRKERGYDTLGRKNAVTSSFSFDPIILKDFLIGINSDPEKYVDTYYQDVFLWEEAEVLSLLGDTTIQIKITAIPAELTIDDGEGLVSGSIEEDFTEEGGRINARRRAARRKCGLRRKRSGGRLGQSNDEFELIAYGETDDNGEFQFGFLPEGTYRFFVEYPGIPIDESSFVQFDVGEAGVTDDSFVLAAVVTEEGISVELVLGVTKNFFTDFSIYPNPTIDIIHIDYNKILSEKITMELIDMKGKVLITRDLKKGTEGNLEMNLKGYRKGQYLLRFFDTQKDRTALTFRIIKQ